MQPSWNKHLSAVSATETSNKELIRTIKKENKEARATICKENIETRKTLQKLAQEFPKMFVETKTMKLAKAHYSKRLMNVHHRL